MRRVWLAGLLAFVACSKKSASQEPAPSDSPSRVGSVPPPSSSPSIAVGPSRVETTVTSDGPSDADFPASLTYDTWLTDGTTRHLLARNGIAPQSEPLNETPAIARIVGNRVQYGFDGQNVPSVWVGTLAAEFTVSPLALVREETHYFNRMQGCPDESSTWNWTTLTGSVSWSGERGGRCAKHEYLPLPDVTLPDEYASDASDLGCHTIEGCSVAVDGTKERGFVTFGKRSAGDPSFRAVVSGRWLFVELEGEYTESSDDTHWVGEDHLEIWVAATGASYMGSDGVAPAQQWGVRVSDARVFAGAGHPATLLRAQRIVCGPRAIELRIELPASHDALTVAYSAASAHRQRMVIATSRLVYGDTASLGAVKRIDPKRVTCRRAGALLAPVAAPVPSDQPMATFE